MSSAAPNKKQELRAAAVLTTGEVASASFTLNRAYASQLSLQLDFTLGSLTNCVFRFYVSEDGATWYPAEAGDGAVSRTYTADTDAAIAFSCAGWRFFRCSAQGTGTVTSSSATITARYLQAGTQT